MCHIAYYEKRTIYISVCPMQFNGKALAGTGADCSKDPKFAATKKIVDDLKEKTPEFPLDAASGEQVLVNGATIEKYGTCKRSLCLPVTLARIGVYRK